MTSCHVHLTESERRYCICPRRIEQGIRVRDAFDQLRRPAIKLSVFCGVSVDGFLARPDNALDFLDAGGQEPHGFEEFYGSVDVVVIGRKTFEVVLKFGSWFYGKKPVFVLSSRPLDFSSVKAAWSSRCREDRPKS